MKYVHRNNGVLFICNGTHKPTDLPILKKTFLNDLIQHCQKTDID